MKVLPHLTFLLCESTRCLNFESANQVLLLMYTMSESLYQVVRSNQSLVGPKITVLQEQHTRPFILTLLSILSDNPFNTALRMKLQQSVLKLLVDHAGVPGDSAERRCSNA